MTSSYDQNEFRSIQPQSNWSRLRQFTVIKRFTNNNRIIDGANQKDKFKYNSNYVKYAKLISYSGGFIQALYITLIFCKFQTTTNVYIRNPPETELPSVSLCFFTKFPFEFMDEDKHGERLTNVTVGQINDHLPDYHSFVQNCKVLDSNYQYQECLSQYRKPIVQYLSLYTKCYTLFENMDEPIRYEKKKIGSKWIVHVILNVTQIPTKRVGIFLTHTSEDLDESLGNPAFLQFDTRDNNMATVTFERTVINKLPPPHESRCFDYSKLSCRNRVSCIRKCIMSLSFTNSSAWINRRYVRADETYREGRFGLADESNYTDHCYRKFDEEPCIDYLYNAIMASQFYSPFRENQTFLINVAYPLGTETIVNYVAVQKNIDYLCFVTSVVSLWTEASMIRISENFLLILTRVMLKLVESRRPYRVARGN